MEEWLRKEFERILSADVVDLLAHVANQSLVMVEMESTGGRRYRLLETVRAYATVGEICDTFREVSLLGV